MRASSIAVVGAGPWGRNICRNLDRLGVLAAVADADAAVATTISGAFGVGHSSFHDLLRDPAIAGIALATPSAQHAEQAAAVIEAGKHVLVEKPMAMSVGEAARLVSSAQRHDRRLMVGHLLLFHPAFVSLRERVLAGAIGRIRAIEATRLGPGRIREDDDALWDLAPHDISMVLALLGADPLSVDATGSAVATPASIDLASLVLRFAGDVEATITVSRVHPERQRRLVVFGEKGTLVFEDTHPDPTRRLVLHPRGVPADMLRLAESAGGTSLDHAATEPLLEECRHFLSSINSGRTPISDGREGLRVVRVLEAASQAIANQCGLVHPSRRSDAVDRTDDRRDPMKDPFGRARA